MPIGSNFKRPVPTAAKPAGRKSRYAGAKVQEPRPPIPHAGALYRFRVDLCEEGHNPNSGNDSFKAHLTIMAIVENGVEVQATEHHKVGDAVDAIFTISNASGIGRVKAFCVATAGFASEGEFDAFDKNETFIDSVLNDAGSEFTGKVSIVGRFVDADVRRGNDVVDPKTKLKTGDYYREFVWAPVPDEEQEVLSAELQWAQSQ